MSHLFPTLTPDLVRKHIQAARKAENPPKLGLAPNVYPSYRVPFKDLRPVHPMVAAWNTLPSEWLETAKTTG